MEWILGNLTSWNCSSDYVIRGIKNRRQPRQKSACYHTQNRCVLYYSRTTVAISLINEKLVMRKTKRYSPTSVNCMICHKCGTKVVTQFEFLKFVCWREKLATAEHFSSKSPAHAHSSLIHNSHHIAPWLSAVPAQIILLGWLLRHLAIFSKSSHPFKVLFEYIKLPQLLL